MTLYVATSNPGKLRDFAVAASQASGAAGRWRIEPLPGLAKITPPEEDQPTFEGNARLKAVYYSRLAGAQALVDADDSGLEVDALGGKPGRPESGAYSFSARLLFASETTNRLRAGS